MRERRLTEPGRALALLQRAIITATYSLNLLEIVIVFILTPVLLVDHVTHGGFGGCDREMGEETELAETESKTTTMKNCCLNDATNQKNKVE